MNRKTADRLQNSALENLGTMDRRKFVHGLGFGTVAALLPASLGTFAGLSAEAAAGARPFPVPTNINHLSCGVKDYAKSRDFYMGLFDMKLVWDNGSMCALEFGNPAAPNGLYIRGLTKPTDKPDVGHVAYGIPNFMKYKAAIKSEMERYHLTEIRPDGEVGWICNDPAGYMLNIIVEKDKAMYPGAAAFCDVADTDKCRQGYAEGVKNLNVGPKPGAAAFKPLYFSHVVLNVPESQLTKEFEFYRDMMGMKVIYRKTAGEPKTFLRFGQNTLYLQKTEKPGEKAHCNHFAFVIENFDFAKVEAELKRRGLDPKPDSKLAWTITDPDGFRVEITAPGLPEHIAKDCNGVNTGCPGGLRG
ncbi:MAG: VOC family protein [Acidobacteriia bacterium]|nr:VOC family protein [Terriglobia bacterium]